MITALDSRVMDANAEALGVSVEKLMGNAGKVIADFLISNYPDKRIAFCCGHGNNGGDGFAAACHVPDSRIYLITDYSKIKSKTVIDYLEKSRIEDQPFSECDFDFDILVDCGLGTGLSGKLRPEYADYVSKVNSFKGTIISVDVPTGFGTDSQVMPDITIVMHELKEGMHEENCGKIIVADIDMPAKAYLETGPGDMLRYPVPKADSHKGNNGSLLIIGGGPYFGAPALAAMAALRAGVDLVTVAAPESVFHEIATTNPTLMIQKLSGDRLEPNHIPILEELSAKNNAVLIGPGLGKDPATVETVRTFVSKCTKPIVIDADGLNALGESFKTDNPNTILTPHHKEFERISGKTTDISGVQELATDIGCTILLKGKTDIICNQSKTKENHTGCAGMTGAGTGDVLAGIVAGLLSKKMNVFDSACLGAYISGKAGEYAFEKKSYGMIATDIVDEIPTVLKNGLKSR